MKVGIDIRSAQTPFSRNRGIGRYLSDLATGLARFATPDVRLGFIADQDAGGDPDFFRTLAGPAGSNLVFCEYRLPHKSRLWWTKIPKLRSQPSRHLRELEIQIKARAIGFERAAQNFDLVHLPVALDVGSFPLAEPPGPVIRSYLDTIVWSSKETIFDRYAPHHQAYFLRQVDALRRSDRLTTISYASRQAGVEAFGLDPEKISVVYPSVNPAYGIPASRPGWLSDQPYLLFCSVPDPHKNPDVVLRAFSMLPGDLRLVFVGAHRSVYERDVRDLANSLKVSDRVLFTGHVAEADMPGLFQHAKALVSPSQMEGFGLPVAQALLAGTPVVTSNVSAQAEVAGEAGWLVDPNSPDAVAGAVAHLLSDAELAQRRVEIGRSRAGLFSPEKAAESLLAVYRSCGP